MKKHCYEVRHEVKHGKHASDLYRYDVEADNMKEAVAIARELWYKNHASYMFNIEVKRIPDDAVIDWANYFVSVTA